MFVREKRVKAGDNVHTYVQIVESRREGPKVKQRVLCSLGNRERLDPAAVDRLVAGLARYGSVLPVPRPGAPEGERHEDPGVGSREDRHYGDLFVLDRVWRDLGLRDLLLRHASQRRFRHDLERATFAMVANRLIEPASKLRTETWLDTKAYLPLDHALTADHLYKTLLWLHDVQRDLEVDLHRLLKRRCLTGSTVYFYDTTLTYFEGLGPHGLAQVAGRKGRVKGKRHLLIGLVTTSDGWPVMHEVFPGASNDIPSFKRVLQVLFTDFGLREVVVICDRGMHSQEVIDLLEEKDGYDYGYIVATRLRKSKEVRDEVLRRAGRYQHVEEGLEVKQVFVDEKRYIVCRNEESKRRDARRREGIVAQLEEAIGDGLPASSQKAIELRASGNKRYLAVRHGKLQLNRGAIKEDARYDGRWVLQTNLRELDPAKVALRYKDEARIERDIRTIKSFAGLRPIHHHNEPWVKGHVMVCVLALVLHRALQERLGTWPSAPDSIEEVLRELGAIRAKEYRVGREDDDPDYFWARSDLSAAQKDLLGRLGIKKLPRTLAPPPRLETKAQQRTKSKRLRRKKAPRPAKSPDWDVLS